MRSLTTSRARSRAPMTEPLPAEPGDPEGDWVRHVDLQRAVQALEPRDRELIGLRYGADLTARQIGDLLEMRTNTVEVALLRALARLRVLMVDETPAGRRNGFRRQLRSRAGTQDALVAAGRLSVPGPAGAKIVVPVRHQVVDRHDDRQRHRLAVMADRYPRKQYSPCAADRKRLFSSQKSPPWFVST